MFELNKKSTKFLYVRMAQANKEFLELKAKSANMSVANLLNLIIAELRTTKEGAKFLEVKDAGYKKSV